MPSKDLAKTKKQEKARAVLRKEGGKVLSNNNQDCARCTFDLPKTINVLADHALSEV